MIMAEGFLGCALKLGPGWDEDREGPCVAGRGVWVSCLAG